MNSVSDSCQEQVWYQVVESLWAQVSTQVSDIVDDQVWYQVRDTCMGVDRIWDRADDQVWHQVGRQVIKDQVQGQ